MKAIIVNSPGGLDRLELVAREDPGKPGPGEIRVRVQASSLNFHDFSVCRGKIPVADQRVPLADGAGTVEAVGEGVTVFRPGDLVVSCFFPDWQDGRPTANGFARVPGDGLDGFAQEVVVLPASAFTKAPASFNAPEAATITTAGVTAWRALVVEGGLKAGDTVLVQGTGGVSIWALLIARALGAQVIAISSSERKLERLRSLGADFTVNYRTNPAWGREIRDWTGGCGVDHVIDVGGPSTLTQSLDAVCIGGHIALIGLLGGLSGEFSISSVLSRQVRIQGLIVGSRRHQQDFVNAIEGSAIHPIVDRTFNFAELADAFRYEESGAHFGKICLSW